MLPKQREAKAAEKEERRRIEADTAARQRPRIERIDAIWQRFGRLREQAGLTPKAYFEAIDCPYTVLEYHAKELEAGAAKLTPETELPFGYNCHLSAVDRWRAAADVLGCTVDYLMMRTDEPRSADEVAAVSRPCAGQTSLAMWIPGGITPAEPCDAVADFSLGEDVGCRPMRMICWWDGSAFCYKRSGEAIDMQVIRWLALPATEDGGEND